MIQRVESICGEASQPGFDHWKPYVEKREPMSASYTVNPKGGVVVHPPHKEINVFLKK